MLNPEEACEYLELVFVSALKASKSADGAPEPAIELTSKISKLIKDEETSNGVVMIALLTHLVTIFHGQMNTPFKEMVDTLYQAHKANEN